MIGRGAETSMHVAARRHAVWLVLFAALVLLLAPLANSPHTSGGHGGTSAEAGIRQGASLRAEQSTPSLRGSAAGVRVAGMRDSKPAQSASRGGSSAPVLRAAADLSWPDDAPEQNLRRIKLPRAPPNAA